MFIGEVPTYRQKQLSCVRVAVTETVTIQAGYRMIVETGAKGQIPEGTWLVELLSKSLWQGPRHFAEGEVILY